MDHFISNNLTYHYWTNSNHTPVLSFSHSHMDADDKANKPSQQMTCWYRIESDNCSHREHTILQVSSKLGQRVHECAPYDRGKPLSTYKQLQTYHPTTVPSKFTRHSSSPWWYIIRAGVILVLLTSSLVWGVVRADIIDTAGHDEPFRIIIRLNGLKVP